MAIPINNPTAAQAKMLGNTFFTKDGFANQEVLQLIYEIAFPILTKKSIVGPMFDFMYADGGVHEFSRTRRGKAFKNTGFRPLDNYDHVRGAYKFGIGRKMWSLEIPDLITKIDYKSMPTMTGTDVLGIVLSEKNEIYQAIMEEIGLTLAVAIAFAQDADLASYNPATMPKKYNLGGSRVIELTDADLALRGEDVRVLWIDKFIEPMNKLIKQQNHDFLRGGQTPDGFHIVYDPKIEPMLKSLELFELAVNNDANKAFKKDFGYNFDGLINGIPAVATADKLPIDENGNAARMILMKKDIAGMVLTAPEASYDKVQGKRMYISNLEWEMAAGGVKPENVMVWVSSTDFDITSVEYTELAKTEYNSATSVNGYDFITKQFELNVGTDIAPLSIEGLTTNGVVQNSSIIGIADTTATLSYNVALNNEAAMVVQYSIDGGTTWVDSASITTSGTKTANITTLTASTDYYVMVRKSGEVNMVKYHFNNFKTKPTVIRGNKASTQVETKKEVKEKVEKEVEPSDTSWGGNSKRDKKELMK